MWWLFGTGTYLHLDGMCARQEPSAVAVVSHERPREVPLYWRRAYGPTPLVTTSPDGTDADLAGELGRSTTRTLLGGVDKLDDQSHARLAVNLSTWLGADQRYGLMFRYWNAGTQDDTFASVRINFRFSRPFLDTSGTASVQTRSWSRSLEHHWEYICGNGIEA
ncbi:MAG: BBP7 family outer membrane beta-barrel protein [Pirellulaceae bacterium]